MPEMSEASVRNLDLAQATILSVLVDLEAGWENMRRIPSANSSTTLDLQGRQKTYEAFRAKLKSYNKRYAPEHVPELLLNTPSRLATWCRTMRDLYVLVEHDPQARCPVHLLEKAHQCAAGISVRMHKEPVSRPGPASTIRDVIRNLERLVLWCDDLAQVTLFGGKKTIE